MPRKPKTQTPDAPDVQNAAQRQQTVRRLAVEHRRLKVAFADTYVELVGVREQNDRLNEIIQEQQRVIREISEKLPKDEPEATDTS
ncbi:hypothetical protein LCGC14_2472890 [marine sediment metagenome]|uniref:Uncharacterized protein n=1 Tax=marine sediment metagenome TaxID=412755 RepID=A0A0F9DM04_9ZZZZ